MTHVVTESCIKCRYTDCVDVCPVDCFREGPNFLAIDPDECIDCAVCVAECPVNAIYAEEDVPGDQQHFTELNADLGEELAEHHQDQSAAAGSRRIQGREGKARPARTLSGARPALRAVAFGSNRDATQGIDRRVSTSYNFASLLLLFCSSIAQSVERRTVNP